jgi:hypothetical protein
MRTSMSVLAAGLVGALALCTSSVEANPAVALNGLHVMNGQYVLVDAPAEAIGEMCYIIQGGQMIGGGSLNGGLNAIPVAFNGMGSYVTADGPGIQAINQAVNNGLDDVYGEE